MEKLKVTFKCLARLVIDSSMTGSRAEDDSVLLLVLDAAKSEYE